MKGFRHFIYIATKHSGYLLPDRLYLSLLFYSKMGYWPSFDHPATFSEKIQWLKLYNRKEQYHNLVDKALVKDYVSGKIGQEHILRTYGVWDNPEDIEWEKLPDRFVLKLTAGGGGRSVCICRDKATFDREDAVRRLRSDYGRNLYRRFREWVYKDVPQRVIAEELLETDDPGGNPPDYKFWCFNGKVRFVMFCRGRDNASGRAFNFFDRQWKALPFWRKYPNSKDPVKKPGRFEDMVRIAETLSKGTPFLRVDLYYEKDKIYFGELTFYPGSGMNPFNPDEWDMKVGKMLKLPSRA